MNAGVGTAAHWKATRNPNSTSSTSAFSRVNGTQLRRRTNSTTWRPTRSWAWKAGKPLPRSLRARATPTTWRTNISATWLACASGRNDDAVGKFRTATTVVRRRGILVSRSVRHRRRRPRSQAGLGPLEGANVVVAVVAITPTGTNPGGQAGYALPPSVANGLTPNYTFARTPTARRPTFPRTLPDFERGRDVTTNSPLRSGLVSVPAVKGAVGYAWFGASTPRARSEISRSAPSRRGRATRSRIGRGGRSDCERGRTVGRQLLPASISTVWERIRSTTVSGPIWEADRLSRRGTARSRRSNGTCTTCGTIPGATRRDLGFGRRAAIARIGDHLLLDRTTVYIFTVDRATGQDLLGGFM